MATQRATDGRQLRWERHNAERRTAILTAAIAELNDNAPGSEVHVADIAKRAGLSRTVLYRHFDDRADLDRSVQTEILDGLWRDLLPGVSLEGGTAREIIRRILDTYVGWAVQNPSLHQFVEIDTSPDGSGPLQRGLEFIAGQVSAVIEAAVALLEVDLSEDEAAAMDPLVHGIVGMVFGAVRRWAFRPVREPDREVFVDLTTETVWHILGGFTTRLGLDLDPDVPVEQLLGVDE
ncbi:TetR/AcrR family transcriptional regulator [Nocardioidaceae bacterium]|nr:TetR/AcrR family transcriptional regulator [Nocardioidaceae bacterium]